MSYTEAMDNASRRTQLFASLEELKKNQYCDFDALCTWLCENLGFAHELVHGTSARGLKDPYWVHQTILRDDKLLVRGFLVAATTDKEKEHLDIAGLEKFFPGLVMIARVRSEKLIKFNFELHPVEWPNLTPFLIWESLHKAFVEEEVTTDNKEMAVRGLSALVARLYPHLTLDAVVLAAHLGMVEDNPNTFVTWFKNNLEKINHADTVVLPKNIGDTHNI